MKRGDVFYVPSQDCIGICLGDSAVFIKSDGTLLDTGTELGTQDVYVAKHSSGVLQQIYLSIKPRGKEPTHSVPASYGLDIPA